MSHHFDDSCHSVAPWPEKLRTETSSCKSNSPESNDSDQVPEAPCEPQQVVLTASSRTGLRRLCQSVWTAVFKGSAFRFLESMELISRRFHGDKEESRFRDAAYNGRSKRSVVGGGVSRVIRPRVILNRTFTVLRLFPRSSSPPPPPTVNEPRS